MSSAYYARIERGEIRLSEEFFRKLCDTLGLGAAEVEYVGRLSGHQVRPQFQCEYNKIPDPLIRLLNHQAPAPAYIVDPFLNIVAFNAATSAVYGLSLEARPVEECNIPWLMFHCGELRRRLVDWEVHARRIVAQCRSRSGYAPTGSPFLKLLESLEKSSVDYRRFWNLAEARSFVPVPKNIRHPQRGDLFLDQSVMHYGDESGLSMIVSTAIDEATLVKLHQLMKEVSSVPVTR